MKLKTTKKQMNEYHYIIAVSYCGAQNLLNCRSPFAYSCGIYGWNADYYDVGGVLIATGYRGFPASKNTKTSYEMTRKYDNLAQGKTKDEIEALLKEFIKEALKP